MAAASPTTNFGLALGGPLARTGHDSGDITWNVDDNMEKVDAIMGQMQEQIETIVVSGLPSVIDGGTF